MNNPPRRHVTPTRHTPRAVWYAFGLTATFLAGCARHVPPAPAAPAAARSLAPVPPPMSAPVVLTSYRPYQPLPPGQQTKSFSSSSTTPGVDTVPTVGGQPPPQGQQSAVQGVVSLDDYHFNITPDGAGGSRLDGSVSVHNHGPYDVTDFQVSVRQGGRLYVLVPPGGGHAVGPSRGTVYTVRASLPLSPDQLKAGKSFFLEAQLDGPPGLATDEEGGVTITNTVPGGPGR